MKSPALVSAVLVVVAVAGCSGTDANTSALETTIRSYSSAIVGGDGVTAYGIASVRCQKAITSSGFEAMAAQARKTYPGTAITSIKVNSISATQAQVTYSYPQQLLDVVKQHWAKVAGTWRWDNC